jgi:spermidine synthase
MNGAGDDEFEILAAEESAIGMICLRQRGIPSEPGAVVTEITLDHQFLMSSENTASERVLATRAIELHGGRDLDVLVGGLGLGYTAHAALDTGSVARVEVVELLAPVIDWLRKDLVPLAPALRGDPRCSVRQGDVYAELASEATRCHDAILIDVDHSPDERLGGANAAFYTESGLRAAGRHLAPGGVLGVWSYAESSPFADALRAVFAEVRVEPVTHVNHEVDETRTDWLFFARGYLVGVGARSGLASE